MLFITCYSSIPTLSSGGLLYPKGYGIARVARPIPLVKHLIKEVYNSIVRGGFIWHLGYQSPIFSKEKNVSKKGGYLIIL